MSEDFEIEIINSTKEWKLIIISQKQICHGVQLAKLLEIFKSTSRVQTCILDDDFEGYSKTNGFWEIVNENQGILSLAECSSFLAKVNLEWGNIFLFDILPEDWELIINEEDTIVKISQATITLRAADACHTLIYSLDESVFNAVRKVFPSAVLEKGKLEELWYPT